MWCAIISTQFVATSGSRSVCHQGDRHCIFSRLSTLLLTFTIEHTVSGEISYIVEIKRTFNICRSLRKDMKRVCKAVSQFVDIEARVGDSDDEDDEEDEMDNGVPALLLSF